MVRQIIRRHGAESHRLLSGRAQYITIWKPLRGPLHDYPLALCDRQTIDAALDLEPQDIVDKEEVLENIHIYRRSKHQWHYLSGQQTSELLIFRQADSRPNGYGTLQCLAFYFCRTKADTLSRHSTLCYQESDRSRRLLPKGKHRGCCIRLQPELETYSPVCSHTTITSRRHPQQSSKDPPHPSSCFAQNDQDLSAFQRDQDSRLESPDTL